MKKYFLFVFCALLLFVVTGCGKNQLVCTGSMEEGGQKVEAEVIAEFDDNDKLVDATITEDLGSKEKADQLCQMYDAFASQLPEGVSINCSGSKVTIKGYAKIDDNGGEDSMIGKTKEEFKKAMEELSEGKVTCK